jgi:hypothetical protein
VQKKIKNALFEQVVAAGLNPADFANVESHNAEQLRFETTYVPVDLLFRISQNVRDVNHYFVDGDRYAGGRQKVPRVRIGNLIAQPKVVTTFRRWLHDNVIAAIDDEPITDMWLDAHSAIAAASVLNAARPDADSSFTEQEREQLRIAITNFHLLVVKTFAPEVEQARDIAARLSYLQTALDRLNRFDWKGVALSTIIGVATSLSLDTERGKLLWRLFQQALGTLSNALK